MRFENPSDVMTFIQQKFGPETPRRLAAFAMDILWEEGLVLYEQGQLSVWRSMVLNDEICEEKWASIKEEAIQMMQEWTWLKSGKEDAGN